MKDEAYWNTKHPFTSQLYSGRPRPDRKGSMDWDVRHFIWHDDLLLKKTVDLGFLRESNPDDTAFSIQRFVTKTITYVGDNSNVGAGEYWMFPNETLTMRTGDCEDGAILIASLLMNTLQPSDYWRVRVAAGWVQASPTAPQGGHAYCTYCRKMDNEWVVLDWCYYPDATVKVSDKKMVANVPWYKDVWFSFNHLHAWSHINFTMKGRVKEI